MATAMLMEWDGVTEEQYDAVMDKLGLDDNPPDGALFHIAGPMDGGWRVLDVWDSEEQFGRFQQERLAPVVQEVGLPGEPNVQFYPVHNVFAPRGDEIVQQGASSIPA
jgi:hypothetical protein